MVVLSKLLKIPNTRILYKTFNLFITSDGFSFETLKINVTGLAIVNEHIISCGGDQKVVLWKWSIVNDRIKVELIAVYHSLIADIHGLDVNRIRE